MSEYLEQINKRLSRVVIENKDFQNLIKGKFLLSYNDCEYVRGLYQDYYIEEIQRNHNLVNRYEGKENTYRELLIRNY